MKKVLFAIAIAATGTLISCGGNDSAEVTETVDTIAVSTDSTVADSIEIAPADTAAVTADSVAAK